MRSHWAWSASTAMTYAPKRAHSTATDPEPAPTSQMVRPGAGPRRASTSARTSALVIIESRCSKASSGRAQRCGAPAWPASQRGAVCGYPGSMATRTLGSANFRWGSALASVRRSCGVPRHSATWTSLPAAISSAAISRTVPGAVRIATLGWASAAARAWRGSRPWAVVTRASSQSRPSRAKASATEDTAGMTWGLIPRARSARTIPKKPGSPEASTATGPELALALALAVAVAVVLALAAMASSASSRRLSSIRAVPPGISAAARWRGAPTTSSAAARAAAASGLWARPSQPITVTVMLLPRGRSRCGR